MISKRMTPTFSSVLGTAMAVTALLCVLFGEGHAAQVKVNISGLDGQILENAQKMTVLPAGLVREGKVDEALLNEFVRDIPDKVREALKPFGYYRPKVESRPGRSGDMYQLNIAVDRGPPVRVSQVHVGVKGPGALSRPLLAVARQFPLREGDVLRQDRYEDAKSQLQSKATDLGYLDADFDAHAIRIWTEEDRADIELEMTTGPQYFFDGVTFTGGSSYPLSFLRRYLAFKPGDHFSYAKLGETQVNLNNSERFRSVIVTPDKKGAKEHRVPVQVGLADAPSRQVRIGGGYGTDTGPRFLLRYQDLNVFNNGHEFLSALDVSQLNQGFANRYVIPSTKDYRSFTAFRLAYLREDVQTYTSNSITFDADRERNLGPGRTGDVFLRLLQERSDIGGQNVTSFLVLPGVRFVAEHFDNLIRPRKGYWVSSELRGTTAYFGSEQTFLQSVTDGRFIYPLSTNFTLFLGSRLGLTLQRESLSDLPASLRFFAGGDRSVRGYAYQSLGPKNDIGDVIGGKNVFIGSFEVERGIAKDWGIAAFYDAGNAFDDFSRITLFQGTGLGVRYYSRVGAIKLDVARPLDRDYPVVRVHFTIGLGYGK